MFKTWRKISFYTNKLKNWLDNFFESIMCSISCLWTHLHLQSRPTSSLVDMKNNCFLVFNFHHQWKKTKWDCVNNIAIKMLAGAGGKAANSYGLTIGLFFSALSWGFLCQIIKYLYFFILQSALFSNIIAIFMRKETGSKQRAKMSITQHKEPNTIMCEIGNAFTDIL